MTPFCFEHVFSAPSTAALFEAYFDPSHQIEQDKVVEITERETIELADRGDEVFRKSRVVPRRQLPAILKPFSSGPLHYIETVTWRKRADEIAIEIRPSLMRGRAKISATYRLDFVSPGSIRRRYAGEVSVDVALISARVERGIVAEFERSMPLAALCTQAWLDRRSAVYPVDGSVTARA